MGVAACKSLFGPEEPDRNWKVFESSRFIVQVRPDSYAERNIERLLADLEAHYTYVLNTLDIVYSGRVAVFFYDSPQDMGVQWPGGTAYPWTECIKAVCGVAYGGVYTAAQHEVTHVITYNALGKPPTNFMSEGTAMGVAMEGIWRWRKGIHIHALSRELIASGRLPPLRTMLENSKWQDLDDDITYPASGSFILYLLERSGPLPIKKLFVTSVRAFPHTFQLLYGLTLEDLESAWKAYCQDWPER